MSNRLSLPIVFRDTTYAYRLTTVALRAGHSGREERYMGAPISTLREHTTTNRIIPQLKTRSTVAPGTTSVRFMTYNVQFGFNWRETLAVIRDYQPEILCLQEVVPERFYESDATCVDQMRDDLGMGPGDLNFLWGKGRRRVGNLTLASWGTVTPESVLRCWPTQPYGMVSRVALDDSELVVSNLHLTPMLGWPPLMFLPSELLRRRELNHFNQWAAGKPQFDHIVAGDLNTFDGAPAFSAIKASWQNARDLADQKMPATRPTYGLRFAIDHILTRWNVRIHNYNVIIGGGSDHRAVTATLEFAHG